MRVIVGCEFSQIVTKAFRERDYEAFSCDLLPTEGNPDWHFQEDILDLLKREKFDLGIFHPPCTYLCNSGVRWLYNKDGNINKKRWWCMIGASNFFKILLNCNIISLAVENPIPHKYAVKAIGRKYDQIIQPWQFGHGETKATCLWLKNLPLLKPTNIVKGRESRIHKMPPSKDRGKLRSISYQGIAEAMANQWG